MSQVNGAPPAAATDAVLVASQPVDQHARQVKGIDWEALTQQDQAAISRFVVNLADQGFQSSSIGDAIRIINDMVRLLASQCGGSSGM